MNLFIPVLYICLNGHCEFLQQLAVYPDEEECKQVVLAQAEKYSKINGVTVEVTCVVAPAKVMENDVKPKRRESI
jgi:hypothetical protein